MAELTSLQINGNTVQDFVVAQGTSGIWKYRKWNSGLAECWGDYLFTPTSFSNISNTLFYCYIGNISTPFKFVSMNTCHINKRNGGYVTWATPNVSLDTTAAVNALIFQYGNSNFAAMRLDIYCKGTWK